MSPRDESADHDEQPLRRLTDYSYAFQDQVSEALRANERLLDSVQQSLAPFAAAQAEMASLARSLQVPQFQVPRLELPDFAAAGIAADALAQLRRQTEELHRKLQASVSPFVDQVRASFETLPPRTRDALLLLGSHGWYLDLEMPISTLWVLEEALEAGETADVEEALCTYFEDHLDRIENTLAERLPERAHLIRAAIGAHRRSEFALSIPVLLAQTDGACKQITHGYFFLRRKSRPEVAAYVDQLASDSLQAALLSPLAESLPIRASWGERDAESTALNRHKVLHGEDLDYGTRGNSLRAVALINYVVGVLFDDSDQDTS